jgi:hypothetical protein
VRNSGGVEQRLVVEDGARSPVFGNAVQTLATTSDVKHWLEVDAQVKRAVSFDVGHNVFQPVAADHCRVIPPEEDIRGVARRQACQQLGIIRIRVEFDVNGRAELLGEAFENFTFLRLYFGAVPHRNAQIALRAGTPEIRCQHSCRHSARRKF